MTEVESGIGLVVGLPFYDRILRDDVGLYCFFPVANGNIFYYGCWTVILLSSQVTGFNDILRLSFY